MQTQRIPVRALFLVMALALLVAATFRAAAATAVTASLLD